MNYLTASKKTFLALGLYTLVGTPIVIFMLGLTQEGNQKSDETMLAVTILSYIVIIYTVMQWVLLYIFNKRQIAVGRKALVLMPLLLLIAYVFYANMY